MTADREPLATAQQLGESFAAIVGSRDWQIDEIPEALPVEENAGDTTNAELVNTSEAPLAEPVNENTVPPSPLQIIEALLFIGGPPLTADHAAEAIRGLSPEQFQDSIDILNRVYRAQNRPYLVERGPQGFVLRVARRYTGVREKLYGGPRETRLTQPALDVLSLIAYRQPISKMEIDTVRGQDSSGIIRQLVRLGLVSSVDAGYQTTTRFLEVFRLRAIEDLPLLGEARRIG